MKKEDSILFNHIREEILINNAEYDSLSKSMSCKEDTKVYRGLNFRTKKEFDTFLELLESGEYKPEKPESFSKLPEVALGFAKSRKTLFSHKDPNIHLEHQYKKSVQENLSGYAGVVVETIIPKGKGIDLENTEFELENEVIFQTNNKIKYSYKIIESYEVQLKNKNININDYISEYGLKGELSNYIIANYAEKINKENQLLILKEVSNIKEKNNTDKNYFIDGEVQIKAIENEGSMLDSSDIVINFDFPNYLLWYKKEIFTDEEVKKELTNKVNNVIEQISEFIQQEYSYSDREESVSYDLSNISQLAVLADKPYIDMLNDASKLSHSKNLDDLNEEFFDISRNPNLSNEEKSILIKEKQSEIEGFLLQKIETIIPNKSQLTNDINKNNNNKKELKNKINRLRKG